MENQSNLWKVFEFTINILQALGEEATPLGLTTKAQACCRLEKWFSESTQLKTKSYHVGLVFCLFVFFLIQVVLETAHEASVLGRTGPGFLVFGLSGALSFHKCIARQRKGISFKN